MTEAFARYGQQERDKTTGRFIHVWGVIDDHGAIEQCQHCGTCRRLVGGRWRKITAEDAARFTESEG